MNISFTWDHLKDDLENSVGEKSNGQYANWTVLLLSHTTIALGVSLAIDI